MSQLWSTGPGESGGLGITFFYTKNHPAESCGTNGLPLTPNTTKVQGAFKELQKVVHDGLCLYVDILKAKHDKIILVQEHYNSTIWKLTEKENNVDDVICAAFSILKALECLHQSGYQHNNLSVDTVLLTGDGKVKLSQYGVWALTGLGEYVSFPVGSPHYMSPESLLQGFRSGRHRSWSSTPVDVSTVQERHFLPSADVWSLGVLMLELVSKKRLWKPNVPVVYILAFILQRLKEGEDSAVLSFAAELGWEEEFKCLPRELQDLISVCLAIDPRNRPTAAELLVLPIFSNLSEKSNGPFRPLNFLSTEFRAPSLVLSSPESGRVHPLRRRSYFELYHLWKLAGGDAEAELKKHGLTKSKPPICTLPRLCIVEGETFGSGKDDYRLYDKAVVTVSFDSLLKRLQNIPEEAYFPLLVESSLPPDKNYTEDSLSLPLVIREGDIEYQLHRIILFERLLKGYPYTRDKIIEEARKDIPPLYRGEVWAAVLGVIGDVQGKYQDIDKESPAPTDRQIEVDIPRCHQYIDLLASPVAHSKFKRILKAWIASHPEYVYWQGLDSLCAPFLLLNFNDEALAYASLSAFIPKYLNGFFRRDNSSVMQEYLTKFSQLLAFHDPLLSVHLAEVRFVPELYAIPWFLTMFAHVFPLQKIFHLWDTLLLGSASFPLFVGLAILRQLRELLMASGFNECISYFSNMPEIDMERCLRDSREMSETTPPSATFREHERKEDSSLTNPAVLTSLSPRTPVMEEENEMGITSIPLEELKTEKCLRISAEDLLNLLRRNELFAVDIRQAQDYSLGAIPGSINLPFSQHFNKTTEQVTKVPTELTTTKKTVVVVSGGRGHAAACMLASALLKLGIHRVCVLHRGVDSLRKTDVLVLPA